MDSGGVFAQLYSIYRLASPIDDPARRNWEFRPCKTHSKVTQCEESMFEKATVKSSPRRPSHFRSSYPHPLCRKPFSISVNSCSRPPSRHPSGPLPTSVYASLSTTPNTSSARTNSTSLDHGVGIQDVCEHTAQAFNSICAFTACESLMSARL